MRRQLIDEYGVAYAILVSRTCCNIHPDPDYAAAIATAFNEWLVEVWLTEHNHDGAFKGSITSDFPHWDFDSPARAFPCLDDDVREAIFSTNAREPYQLDQ